MINILFCLFLLGGIFANTVSFGQEADVNFGHFSMGEGLSQNSVTCIYQDSKGFLWIGTQSGLNKYDGRSFYVYKNEPLDPRSLSNNFVNSIAEDLEGNLWIATEYGLNCFDRNTGKFTTYFHDKDDESTISSNYVYRVYVDRTGVVWVKTLRFLDKIDAKTGTVKHYEHFYDVFNPIAENCFFPIYQDSYGLIWVGTNDGANLFDLKYEQFINLKYDDLDDKSLSCNEVRCFFEDSKNNIWIGTSDGLNKYNRNRRIFTRYYYQEDTTNKSSITSISEDNNGNLWLGTLNDGLLKFNPEQEIYTNYVHDKSSENGLASNTIYYLFKDYSDILWIGTRAGLQKLDIKKKKFNLYKKNTQFPIVDNDITAVLYYDEDMIFIGSRSSGLSLFNRKDNSIKNYTSAQGNIEDNKIYAISRTSLGTVLIGTEKGVSVFEDGRWKSFLTKFPCKNGAVLHNKRITVILEDSHRNLWFGSNQGLYKYLVDEKRIVEFYHDYNNITTLSSNNVNTIFEDSKGNIWIGTSYGLNRYESDIEMFERKMYEKNSNQGLSHNTIYSIVEDDEGFIWIGTGAGLDKFDYSNGIFSYINEKDGLPNNQIYSVVKNQSNLWISTNKGIAMLSLGDTVIRSYDVVDGLQGYEFNPNSASVSPEGEIFFGGIDGLNSFFPDSIKNNSIVPKILITSLKVYSNDAKSVFLIEGKDELILPSDSHTFTIEFAALEYTQPLQNSYEYFMEGLDNEWLYIGNRNFASFSNIPSGSYTFQVRGTNNDQVWNMEGAQLKIVIETPLWKNKWAIIIYILSIALLIYLYIEYRTRTLRVANKILIDKQEAAQEIAKQKEELIIKNKNIMDSITYAKRIQWAIMPSRAKFKYLIPQSFILYKPKDIVSGDFYWITEIDEKIFIAAVDCTGHGVPGAFMSIIGYDLLRNITKERKIHKPAEVLDYINKALIELLTKNVMEDDEVKDGMDIALCVFHKTKGIVEFAGAFNPLYLIRNNKIMTIKGDRFSVGLGNEHIEETFKNHVLKLQQGDKLYIFSDGYADQFGGPNGKKMKYRRFRHLLLSIHNLSFPQQMEYLDQHFDSWRGQLEQVDDILVLGMNFDKYLEKIGRE